MTPSKHIPEIVADVRVVDATIAAFIAASDACVPPSPACKRALACARTKLDEARHWLNDAQAHAEGGGS